MIVVVVAVVVVVVVAAAAAAAAARTVDSHLLQQQLIITVTLQLQCTHFSIQGLWKRHGERSEQLVARTAQPW